MHRRLLIALLALGTVGGYTAGFASLACRAKYRREAFERHVAQVCVEAARSPEGAPRGEEPRRRRWEW